MAIPWIDAMSTSNSWGINRLTTPIILQRKLVGIWLMAKNGDQHCTVGLMAKKGHLA